MNEKKAIVLMNHDLLEKQKNELVEDFGIQSSNVIWMPEKLRFFWSNVKPNGPLPIQELSSVIAYLEKTGNSDDYIIVQGDFGCTYYIVDWAFLNNWIPLYATTQRESTEILTEQGVEIQRQFVHDHFRRYEIIERQKI